MATNAYTAADEGSIPEVPFDETGRLGELHALGLLDAPADPHMDRITEFASALFRIPVALVSVVDTDRLWFASAYGTTRSEAPRERSFCAQCIANGGPLVVSNALEDRRFRDSELVAGESNFRFYAGVPLRGPGNHPVATLCVLDTLPRHLTPDQHAHLDRFAGLLEDRIWQRYDQQSPAFDSSQHEHDPGPLACLRRRMRAWINPAACGPARRRFAAVLIHVRSLADIATRELEHILQPDELIVTAADATGSRLMASLVACEDADDVLDSLMRPRIAALQRTLSSGGSPPAVTAGVAVYPDDARHADFLVAQVQSALEGERAGRRIEAGQPSD